MPQEEQVTAKIHGTSGETFPAFVRAVLSLICDGDVTGSEGIKMLEDIAYCAIVYDPDGWYEPTGNMALHPVVWEAIQRAKFRVLEDAEEDALRAA